MSKIEVRLIRRCECGCDRFYAAQINRQSIANSKTPGGPYECMECGAEYEEIRDVPALPALIFTTK